MSSCANSLRTTSAVETIARIATATDARPVRGGRVPSGRLSGFRRDMGEQLSTNFRIADLPDHAVGEIVMDVDEGQDEDRRRLPRFLAEDVVHRPHQRPWNDE